MPVKIKICGITRPEDSEKAAEYGADAIGMILSPEDKGIYFARYIDKDKAMEIVNSVPDRVRKVGVFINEEPEKINQLVEWLDLDFVQLHGEEKPEDFGKINCDIIKVIKVSGPLDLEGLHDLKVQGILFDRIKGRSEETLNFEVFKNIQLKTPWFLAGGLNPNNVAEAIHAVYPDWVDVSSGVELSTKGEKDIDKIKLFIDAARNA